MSTRYICSVRVHIGHDRQRKDEHRQAAYTPFRVYVRIIRNNLPREKGKTHNVCVAETDHRSCTNLSCLTVNAMPPAEYAQKVVSEVIKPRPRNWLWVGTHSFFCWFVDTFFGQWAFVSASSTFEGVVCLVILIAEPDLHVEVWVGRILGDDQGRQAEDPITNNVLCHCMYGACILLYST